MGQLISKRCRNCRHWIETLPDIPEGMCTVAGPGKALPRNARETCDKWEEQDDRKRKS